jgi:hypothetical protein
MPLLVTRDLFFSNHLIGRFIDFSLPSDPTLLRNAFEWPFIAWINTVNYGARTGFPLTLIPTHLFLYAPWLFTDSIWVIGRWQLIAPLYLTTFGFVCLYRSIKYRYGDKLSATSNVMNGFTETTFVILFTYTSYYLSELSYGSFYLIMSFSGMPLAVAAFIRFLDSRHLLGYIAPAAALCVAGSALQFLALTSILMFGIAAVHKKWRYYFIVLSIYALLSLYWTIPLSYSLLDIVTNEITSGPSPDLSGLKVRDLLLGRDYYGQRMIYEKILGDGVLTSLPALSSVGILVLAIMIFKNKVDLDRVSYKISILLLLISLLAIFMAKGKLIPFGIINEFLYENINLLILFRSLQRFVPLIVICGSMLVGLSLVINPSNLKLNILIICAILGSLPWWYSGDLGSKNLESQGVMSRVTLFNRNSADDLISKLQNDQGEFTILTSPPSNSLYFHESNSQGGDPDFYHGNKGYISSESASGALKNIIDKLELDMYTNKNFLLDNALILNDLGVKYFVVRKNASPLYTVHWRDFNANIEYTMIPGIHSNIHNDSSVSIYRLNSWRDLFHLSELRWPCISSSDKIFRNVDQLNNSPDLIFQKNTTGTQCPKIDYIKRSITEYEVKITDAGSSVELLMNKNYHNFWRLGLLKSAISDSHEILSVVHSSTSDNKNYWTIDVKKFCTDNESCIVDTSGKYSFTSRIFFVMQYWVYTGLILSGIFWFMTFIYLIFYQFTTRKNSTLQ